jgi:hypothetical protein
MVKRPRRAGVQPERGFPSRRAVHVPDFPAGGLGSRDLAFHQEHLPNPRAREERRGHFAGALDRLEELAA